MSKLTFAQKKKLARRLITKQEIAQGISIWDSKAWLKRKTMRRIKALVREGVLPHGAIS